MPKAKSPDGRGRRAHYTPRIAERICEHIAMGDTIQEALDKEPMGPKNVITFYNWLKNYPEFRERYEQARQLQADIHADKILQLVPDILKNPKNAAAYRVATDVLKWTAEVRNPKRFGQKVQHEIRQPMAPGEIQQEIARLQDELKGVIDVKAIEVSKPAELEDDESDDE